MIFVFDNSVHDFEVTYDDDDDAILFKFTDCRGHKMIIKYWTMKHGGHQRYIENYQNGYRHGAQYWWYSMQHGGHQQCIENYQNGKKHGAQYWWYYMQCGGHQQRIENYQNDQKMNIIPQ
jgi:antitoxin component YwqK of YwqJK toxin-antitoxin module